MIFQALVPLNHFLMVDSLEFCVYFVLYKAKQCYKVDLHFWDSWILQVRNQKKPGIWKILDWYPGIHTSIVIDQVDSKIPRSLRLKRCQSSWITFVKDSRQPTFESPQSPEQQRQGMGCFWETDGSRGELVKISIRRYSSIRWWQNWRIWTKWLIVMIIDNNIVCIFVWWHHTCFGSETK